MCVCFATCFVTAVPSPVKLVGYFFFAVH